MAGAPREAFLAAFETMGGVERLTRWAADNPAEFYAMFVKLAPPPAEAGGAAADVSETPLSEAEWRTRAADAA